DAYTPETIAHFSDPEVNPFSEDNDFRYHAAWTGGLLKELSFTLRILCIDTHRELVDAWREIIAAGQPSEAMEVLQDLSAVGYDAVRGPIRQALRSGKAIDEVRLGQQLSRHFREQYNRARELARASRR